MKVLLIACFVLLASFDSYGAARRVGPIDEGAVVVDGPNPYRTLFEAFSGEGTAVGGAGGREAFVDVVPPVLNRLFDQTEDIFTDKSYFFVVFRAGDQIAVLEEGKKALRLQHRRNFLQSELGDVGVFKLLLNLDQAQDDENRVAFAKCLESIFEDRDSKLQAVREHFKKVLVGDNLRNFIRSLDSEVFFSHETALVKELKSIYQVDGSASSQEKATFARAYGKIFGKLGDLEAKIATPYSLCLSRLGCVGAFMGGIMAFTYNTSTSSLTGTGITHVDESVASTTGNDTTVLNTTTVSKGVLLDYQKITSSNPQKILGGGVFFRKCSFWL